MKPPISRMVSLGPARSLCCPDGDYPGRVQVKEGDYTGGGNNSRFIGRGSEDLGLGFEDWPVVNPSPFQK